MTSILVTHSEKEITVKENISDILRRDLKIVEPYPELIAPTGSQVSGTAFFPGGSGVYCGSTAEKSILVLGQDFSTIANYNNMLAGISSDLSCPTWKNIMILFHEAGIDLKSCFFSNVFMGLRRTATSVGKYPGYHDKEFVKRNRTFLQHQIEVISPRGIITLGKYASEMLAQTYPKELKTWLHYEALRNPDCGIIPNIHLTQEKCCCVAIEHPSMRQLNVHRRSFMGAKGNEAEVLMLQRLCEMVNLNGSTTYL